MLVMIVLFVTSLILPAMLFGLTFNADLLLISFVMSFTFVFLFPTFIILLDKWGWDKVWHWTKILYPIKYVMGKGFWVWLAYYKYGQIPKWLILLFVAFCMCMSEGWEYGI